MSDHIRLETRAPFTALVQRHTVPMSQIAQVMGRALGEVHAACTAHQLTISGPPLSRYVGEMQDPCTFEPGIPVDGVETAPPGFHLVQVAGGELAVVVHQGSYQTLGRTWMRAFQWVKAQGRQLADAPWESYLTDPATVPNPEDWRTEICLPLAPR